MPAIDLIDDTEPALPAARHFATRFLEWTRQWWNPAPDRELVARVAQTAARHAALRHWLLVIASEPPRLRRALLTRAAEELRTLPADTEAADALEHFADTDLLHAVTETLLRQHGLEPLAPAHRIGRAARVRLAELSSLLQAQDSGYLCA